MDDGFYIYTGDHSYACLTARSKCGLHKTAKTRDTRNTPRRGRSQVHAEAWTSASLAVLPRLRWGLGALKKAAPKRSIRRTCLAWHKMRRMRLCFGSCSLLEQCESPRPRLCENWLCAPSENWCDTPSAPKGSNLKSASAPADLVSKMLINLSM